MTSTKSIEELLVKLKTWKAEMERKSLRVNMRKTKIMVSGPNLDLLKKSGKVHKKCSGIKGPFGPDPDFRCAHCLGKACPIDGRLVKENQVDDKKVEAVPEFCYLRDMLSTGRGCEQAAVTRCKLAWGKFRQLLPIDL